MKNVSNLIKTNIIKDLNKLIIKMGLNLMEK